MQKHIFHNYKTTGGSLEKKKLQSQNIDRKISVDINKLLNRVKIDRQNENKQKVIFFTYGILLISLMGIFVSIVR
jgi:hypothetical protein